MIFDVEVYSNDFTRLTETVTIVDGKNLLGNMLEDGFVTIVLHTLSTTLFFILTLNLFRYLIGDSRIHIRDVTKEHNWKSIRRETKVYVLQYTYVQHFSNVFIYTILNTFVVSHDNVRVLINNNVDHVKSIDVHRHTSLISDL